MGRVSTASGAARHRRRRARVCAGAHRERLLGDPGRADADLVAGKRLFAERAARATSLSRAETKGVAGAEPRRGVPASR